MNRNLRIAIIGGGPGGLTLTRILACHGIRTTVFERETHPLERPQGGTLDLHEDSGQEALRRAGLMEEFTGIARYEDQGTRLLDMAGNVLFEDAGVDGDRPEVDRTALRAMLLASLPEDCVRWGYTLRAVETRDDGRHDLIFDQSPASEGPFDLVVGADGTWSAIRPLLSPYQPQYSGLTFLEFGIDDADHRHPALSALVGRGKMCVEGDGKAIIALRNGNAHIRGYAIFRVPADWAAQRFDLTDPASVHARLLREFAGYAPDIIDLFHASNACYAIRSIYSLPPGHCWTHRRGLTLIGDSAHVMSPFGGDGVNNAMFDAAELARHLIAALADGADWDAAVAGYEAAMPARVAESAEGAAEAAATLLSHDGQALTLERYRSHAR
jgi:2-polyprenyl-6-methoxyphenol hydroxylase-like FAD-dependent oxidoreductase